MTFRSFQGLSPHYLFLALALFVLGALPTSFIVLALCLIALTVILCRDPEVGSAVPSTFAMTDVRRSSTEPDLAGSIAKRPMQDSEYGAPYGGSGVNIDARMFQRAWDTATGWTKTASRGTGRPAIV